MNLKLEKKALDVVKSGDILVFRNPNGTDYTHYLIVENKPKGQFTLLNLGSNCLMSSVTTYNVKTIVPDAVRKFPQLKFDGIILSSQYEVRYVD